MKKIMQSIKSVVLTSMLLLTMVSQAWAEKKQSGGVSAVEAETLSNKLVDMVNTLLMPFGSLVILVAVVISAFKIITSANKPEERARAMGSLPYIIGGVLLLGGAMLVAGVILGQWTVLEEVK